MERKRARGKFDEFGMKDGVWTYYRSHSSNNKKLFSTKTFKNGTIIGKAAWYDSFEQLREVVYLYGLIDYEGERIIFHY